MNAPTPEDCRNDQSAIRHDNVRYHLHPRCALRPRPRRRLRRARRHARACRPRAPRPGRPRREEGCVRRPAPQLFQPFCCCRPPRRSRPGARARCGRGIRRTPVAWVRPSRDARSSRVSRRDPRASLATPASAPSPPSPRASPPSSLQAPRLSNQHLTTFEFLPRAQAPSPLARSPSPPPDPGRPLSRISASRTSTRR